MHSKKQTLLIINDVEDRDSSISKVVAEAKQLWIAAMPMILAGVVTYGKSFISTLYMGRIGGLALAGGSLAIGTANIFGYSIIAGLAGGMEGIASQAVGAKEWRLLSLTLTRTILILLFISTPLSLFWLNSEPFLLFFSHSPAVARAGATFLAASVPSLVIQALISPLRIHLRAQDVKWPLMLSALVALIVHVPANYFLERWLGPGVRTVVFAGAVSDLHALVVLVWYACARGQTRPSLSAECFEYKELGAIFCQGSMCCVSVCLEWWWYELMIVFSGLLSNSDDAIAAMGVLIQATALVYQFPAALSQAASARVGNKLGANNPDEAKTTSWAVLFCGVLTGFAAMVVMISMRDTWAGFITDDTNVGALVAAVLPVAGLCELGNCPQTAACGVLRGSTRPKWAAGANLLSFYGVGLAVAVAAAVWVGKGLVGLWLGLLAAQGVCVIAMVVALARTDWQVQAERARELTGTTESGAASVNEEAYSQDVLGSDVEAQLD